jgi:hypothetical protein
MKTWFVARAWQKSDRDVTEAEHRYLMTVVATAAGRTCVRAAPTPPRRQPGNGQQILCDDT